MSGVGVGVSCPWCHTWPNIWTHCWESDLYTIWLDSILHSHSPLYQSVHVLYKSVNLRSLCMAQPLNCYFSKTQNKVAGWNKVAFKPITALPSPQLSRDKNRRVQTDQYVWYVNNTKKLPIADSHVLVFSYILNDKYKFIFIDVWWQNKTKLLKCWN